jgi:hypothetical protein
MPNELTVTLTRANVGEMAKRLREYLAAGEHPIKQTHALEAIAKALGYRNWNTLEPKLVRSEAEPTQQIEPAEETGSDLPSRASPNDEHSFEFILKRSIGEERWRGLLGTLVYRGNSWNIARGDDVLFKHRDFFQCDLYVGDKDIGLPYTTDNMMGAMVRKLIGFARYMQFKIEQKDPYKFTMADGATPAAVFRTPLDGSSTAAE